MRQRLINALNNNTIDVTLLFEEYSKKYEDLNIQTFAQTIQMFLQHSGLGLDIYRNMMVELKVNKIVDKDGLLIKAY